MRDVTMEEKMLAELRELRRRKAPATLLPAVLQRVGLADRYWRVQGPLGALFVAYTAAGISAVARAEHGAERFEREYRARRGRHVYATQRPPARLAAAVERRFAGDRRAALRFDLHDLSEFERAVLAKALEIPRGEVRPYGWIAREIGRPRAVRAVGSALGRNPVPLLIPCHRVVRGDGSIGEYVFGSGIKGRLLEAEGLPSDELAAMARGTQRFVGSETTGIFCYPTCASARRIAPAHRVEFADERRARGAGYRPCKRCRPAVAS
ncbi:MAG TPA: methylated-DNA--[protein]-cysteine S-methyltransferase [Candidatus Dormibacteraeota bacterium]|nr:methylated-DNA--[protein]-cysteine S-methyltransferase [Candidatus Dormibacteraeota bacterium]